MQVTPLSLLSSWDAIRSWTFDSRSGLLGQGCSRPCWPVGRQPWGCGLCTLGNLPQPAPSPVLPGAVKATPSTQLPKLETSLPSHPHTSNPANSSSLPSVSGTWPLLVASKAAAVAGTMASPDQHPGSHQLSPLSGHSLETSQTLSYLKRSHDYPFPPERNPASAHRPGAFLPHAGLSSPACSSNSEWCPAWGPRVLSPTPTPWLSQAIPSA